MEPLYPANRIKVFLTLTLWPESRYHGGEIKENPMDKDEKKKDEKKQPTYKKYRTGEDIDMLNERYSDPQSGSWGSVRYKDDIDGA